MKVAGLAVCLFVTASSCFSQNNATQHIAFSVWSIHTPDTIIENRSPYPVGALTPPKDIVIRRLEAISNRGPSKGLLPSGEPIACPVQYALELTDGTFSQTVDISNHFLHEKTSQTYTDSGPLDLRFNAGKRILVSMVAPKPQFPPVSCTIMGLDISIQYALANQATERKSSASDTQ
jgi:hypothetical protein